MAENNDPRDRIDHTGEREWVGNCSECNARIYEVKDEDGFFDHTERECSYYSDLETNERKLCSFAEENEENEKEK
jgi:hypothetical protein